MRTMQDAVQDGVRERRIADVVVPVLDGELARHDAGTAADAIVDQLEQIVALPRPDGGDRKIVDDQHADLGDGGEALAKAPVGMAEGQFFEQPRRAHVQYAQAVATGLMSQRTRQKAFSAASRTIHIMPGITQIACSCITNFIH